jgi:hypothetical protein
LTLSMTALSLLHHILLQFAPRFSQHHHLLGPRPSPDHHPLLPRAPRKEDYQHLLPASRRTTNCRQKSGDMLFVLSTRKAKKG